MIKTWIAFIVYSLLMLLTFVWKTFYSNAPYEVFAINFTLGFSAYTAKRLIQKGKWFNGEGGCK